MIFLATGYDGEPASIARPTDGLVVQANNVGIGNFSTSDPGYKLHVKGTGYFTSTLTAGSLATNSFLNNAGSLLFSAGQTTGTTRSLNLRTISPTNDPSSVDLSDATGITWGQRTDSLPYYIIYPKKRKLEFKW